MRRGRKTGKLRAILLAAAVLAATAAQTAMVTPADERKPSLSFEASSSTTGKAVAGAEWSVYRAADMAEDETYRLSASFASSGLEIKKLENAGYMRDAAEKMVEYVEKNKIEADGQAVTDKNGCAVLKDLEKGIYLVRLSGTPGTDLDVESIPFFVTLPILEVKGENGTWNYDIIARPKVSTSKKPDESKPDESKPDESKPDESKPDESKPGESKPDESKPDESKPGESKPDESRPDESKPGESRPDESRPGETESGESAPGETGTEESGADETTPGTTGNTPGGGGSGGSHDRDHGGRSPQGGGVSGEEILDNPTPLASFPQSPQEPELVEIEELPVPLAGLPHIPKLGDMGTGGYLAGLLISLLVGAAALAGRRKYGREEQ